MFQFTSTNLINSNVDSSGLPRWTAQAEDTLQDPPVVGSFNVKRVLNFLKPRVSKIYKRAYSAPVLAKATLSMASITQASGVFRIAMYIRLSGSQNSYYSNDMLFKGKPMYIEFTKNTGETAAQVATKVANLVKKFQAMYGIKWLNVAANGDNVEITAIDEYQRFTKMDLEYLDPAGRELGCTCATDGFVVIASAKETTDPEYDGTNTLVQGVEGFGTYEMLMKNYRLPTAANTSWTALTKEEAPIVGGQYNQYTIQYRSYRGILGTNAVGDEVTSLTTHVFFVNTNVATAFETALANVGTIEAQTKP